MSFFGVPIQRLSSIEAFNLPIPGVHRPRRPTPWDHPCPGRPDPAQSDGPEPLRFSERHLAARRTWQLEMEMARTERGVAWAWRGRHGLSKLLKTLTPHAGATGCFPKSSITHVRQKRRFTGFLRRRRTNMSVGLMGI